MLYKNESDELKKSSWPRCDELASRLGQKGLNAADALEEAAKSRTHHVRSASLRSLNNLSAERGKTLALKLLEDRAYEVRETAAKILGVPVPESK